jgi:hypothetical protein
MCLFGRKLRCDLAPLLWTVYHCTAEEAQDGKDHQEKL